MPKKKRRRGGMSGIRKAVRKWGSALGSGIIILGASHGVVKAVTESLGDPKQIPERTLRNYTGVDYSGSFDQAQLIRSITIIGASLGAGWLIKQAARRA